MKNENNAPGVNAMLKQITHAIFGAAAMLAGLVTMQPAMAQAVGAQPLTAQQVSGRMNHYLSVADFQNPPQEARPRTWWHWTNGHVTLDGITKDLEWMKEVGIGGFQLAYVSAGSGQTVDEQLFFGDPKWFEAVHHAAAEADRLDLEMAMFSSPGWSETGGPWVTPEQGMKRMVHTETRVTGPVQFDDVLPQAPAVLDYYQDSVVMAFPAPADELEAGSLQPIVRSSGGDVDQAALLDGDRATGMTVATPAPGEAAWVELEFDAAFRARAITISGNGGGRNGVPVGRVMAGDTRASMRTVIGLPGTQLYRQGSIRTYAIPETAAKFWRIEMTGAPLDPALTMSQDPPNVVDSYGLSEFRPHGGARIHRYEEKAGSSQFLFEYETVPTPAVPATASVEFDRILDITDSMDEDGRLSWDVPEGEWVIQRMGYVPTGARNRPATGPGSGLEADKLSGEHMEAYFHGYLDPIAELIGPLFGGSLQYLVMDSWEAGMQNWTDEMIDQFTRRRGYDPTPYLPAMTGYVVGDAEISDRFLWDFRRTLADMWAEYHYGTLSRLAEENNMGIYSEAAGVSLEIPEDTLLNKKNVEIPMGEFWMRDLHPRLMYFQDVRGAASASHVYGKVLTAAESFTGGGYESPLSLKSTGDYWLAQGINRLVFHTSAHQPLDTKPGNTMVGSHINRNLTWADRAEPLMSYFSRQLYMLQQGQFVADIAYLLNEGAPSTPSIWGTGTSPTPPEGYDYDFINADVLLNLARVDDDGNIVLPSGMSYKLLVLPEAERMRPELLDKILELVAGGATVTGPKPLNSPSLTGFPAADAEVSEFAAAIWGDMDGVSRTVRYVGDGTVFWGRTFDEIFDRIEVAKDFEYGGGTIDAEFAWLHRRAGDTDFYYVANLTDEPQMIDARFRVANREAEFWDPGSGTVEPASFAAQGDHTVVPMQLAPREMTFVVFPRDATVPGRSLPQPVRETVATINGPWTVNFQEDLGAPAAIVLDTLAPWSEHSDDGVRYFSGTATYTQSFESPDGWRDDDVRVLLDLGEVGDMALVTVNGEAFDLVWKPPYQVDVTDALQRGRNDVAIEVTNQWTNRIAGDRVAPEGERVLSGSGGGRGGFGGGNANVPASGLLGPVTLVRETTGVAQ